MLARLAAPFLPFLAEEVHAALGGAESVHLEDWPAPRDDVRDDALVAEMRRLRDAVRIARRIREQAGASTASHSAARTSSASARRSPPPRATRDRAQRQGGARVTDVASAVRTELVLDYARLSKRLRGQVKAAAARRGEFRELPDGRFEVAGCVLAADEVTRRFVAQGAAVAAVGAEGGLVVALDLAVDDVLAREGLGARARPRRAGPAQAGAPGLRRSHRARRGRVRPRRRDARRPRPLARRAVPGDANLDPPADPLGSAVLEVGDAAIEVTIAGA